jgi:hypothetical protein
MKKLSKPHPNQPNFRWDEDSPALRAKLRMVELPTDQSRPIAEQAVFPCKDAWVPVSIVNGNVYILPGVPKLCKFRGGGSRVRSIHLGGHHGMVLTLISFVSFHIQLRNCSKASRHAWSRALPTRKEKASTESPSRRRCPKAPSQPT